MDHLSLFSKNCKVCKSLDPDEVRLFPTCHYDKGNKECPAQEIQLVVVGQAQRWATLVLKARVANNINTEVKILLAVAKRSKAFQQKFREWSMR